jgi:hypothetical protein
MVYLQTLLWTSPEMTDKAHESLMTGMKFMPRQTATEQTDTAAPVNAWPQNPALRNILNDLATSL